MSAAQRELVRALARAEAGKSLSAVEATALLGARDRHLKQLCDVAGRVRDAALLAAGRPGQITYSPKVFIPLTQLCRDRCHYCTFASAPSSLSAPYLTPTEVLAIARAGVAAGGKEALFTLGDQPELRWPIAKQWLTEHGHPNTLAYLRDMAILVLEETGLLPHLNPGVMSWDDLQRLRPVAPSMGMMLESTATDLFTRPGAAHFGSPDKDPKLRIRVLEDAGRVGVPFTTGILVGIGETLRDRVDSLLEIRRISREYGSIQEVIVQNFRPKPGTAMAKWPVFEGPEFLATIAVARILLGPGMSLQVPPNLSDFADLGALLAAGVDDLGGISPVTVDHVNPERPWPQLSALGAQLQTLGFSLVERLTIGPRFVRGALAKDEPWLDSRLREHVAALAAPSGLANPRAVPVGRPWRSPEFGRVTQGVGPSSDDPAENSAMRGQRGDFHQVYGDWDATAARLSRAAARTDCSLSPDVRAALRRAEREPAALSDEQYLALVQAKGADLAALTALADDLRRVAVGDDVTYVVNRNINFTNICYVGCRFCAFAQRKSDPEAFSLSLADIAERTQEARGRGATEICLQGGISPDLGPVAYLDIIRTVRRATPEMHIHAFSPMEISMGAAAAGVSIRDWLLELQLAGLNSIPGTAAEILDDDIRWVLTKGKLPASKWVEVVTTAHEIGLRSSSTMMYGHIDHPRHWVAHLRILARVQEQTGGFTEFVPLPFIPTNAPVYLAGLARPGPTERDNRAVHALARIMLHGCIANIQASWVKVGSALTAELLCGGANDLGGTLMEETISRMAGSVHGSARSVTQLREIANQCGRPARERTTLYAEAQQSH